jgi:uncharacterized protein (TIGR00255 family)
MTGYGKASEEFNGRQYIAEVRSVNGKQIDLNVRTPGEFRSLEPALRKEVGPTIERGKSELSVYVERNETSKLSVLNKEVLNHYHDQIKGAADELGLHTDGILRSIVRMPDVFGQEKQADPTEEEEAFVIELAKKAAAEFESFRLTEGEKLQDDLMTNRNAIVSLLERVEELDPQRTEALKNRLSDRVKELRESTSFDESRFEQEMLYYMEKLDINEEKVRLRGHCDYFVDTINGDEANGRKLGFICQEMGREINTLGSKANHAEMQRLVVQMKDHLEKIKEQVLNAL